MRETTNAYLAFKYENVEARTYFYNNSVGRLNISKLPLKRPSLIALSL